MDGIGSHFTTERVKTGHSRPTTARAKPRPYWDFDARRSTILPKGSVHGSPRSLLGAKSSFYANGTSPKGCRMCGRFRFPSSNHDPHIADTTGYRSVRHDALGASRLPPFCEFLGHVTGSEFEDFTLQRDSDIAVTSRVTTSVPGSRDPSRAVDRGTSCRTAS